MSEQWPVAQASRPELQSVEDLPVVRSGYDQERVQEAFDAFHRRIAKLDATLQTLEAVEAFGRQAAELRRDLRAVRQARWAEDWAASYGRAREPVRIGGVISPVLPRLVAEVAFLIAVAVFLGVGDFRATVIVGVMAAAWLLVALVEWLVGREPGFAYVPTPQAEAPAPAPEPAHGWPDEAPPDEGLTMVDVLEPSRRRWFRRRAEVTES